MQKNQKSDCNRRQSKHDIWKEVQSDTEISIPFVGLPNPKTDLLMMILNKD